MVERPPCKRQVMGSIPIVGFIKRMLVYKMDGYPSGQRGLTVNQMANAFGGSNPPPSTNKGAAERRHHMSSLKAGHEVLLSDIQSDWLSQLHALIAQW